MVARGYEITNIVEALRVGRALAAGDFDDPAWARARAAHVARYWSCEEAPTGEWIDLALTVTKEGRDTDWDFRSGMTAAARVRPGSVTSGLRVPWQAFGRTP